MWPDQVSNPVPLALESDTLPTALCYAARQSVIMKGHSVYIHWLGAYRTNALYSGHIFVRFNDLEDVFT